MRLCVGVRGAGLQRPRILDFDDGTLDGLSGAVEIRVRQLDALETKPEPTNITWFVDATRHHQYCGHPHQVLHPAGYKTLRLLHDSRTVISPSGLSSRMMSPVSVTQEVVCRP